MINLYKSKIIKKWPKKAKKWFKKHRKIVCFAVVSLILANIALPSNAKNLDQNTVNVKAVLKAKNHDIISEKILAYKAEQEAKKQVKLAYQRRIYPKATPGELYTYATAYTSSVAETDSTPCITADGYNVCEANEENVIATNFLPFGTVVKIPEVYGDREFIVHDRMNRRYSNRIDIWMKDRGDAIQFGKQQVKIVVVE